MLDDVEAECSCLHRVLPACLQHQAEWRLRQAVENGRADGHEAKRDPVVGVGVDCDDVGNRQADLAAGEVGKHDHKILQHQHGDERRQAEIGSADAQGGQRQHKAGDHGRQRAQQNAYIDRQAVLVIDDAGGIGANADQESRAEIHFTGKAEQQVPGHGKHAEIIGDGQQAQHVAGNVERQRCRNNDDEERYQEQSRFEEVGHDHLLPRRPCGRIYMTTTKSSSAGIVR